MLQLDSRSESGLASTFPGRRPAAALAAGFVVSVGWAWLCGLPSASAADVCPEPNDSPESACELPDGQAEGVIDSNEDADGYRIQVDNGQSVAVKLTARAGNFKLRLEMDDRNSVAEVGLGPSPRQVLAERLPSGMYYVYVAAEDADVPGGRPYVLARSSPSGPPVPVRAADRLLRDLAMTPAEAGEKAFQTEGRLMAGERGRWYQAIYERENVQAVRKLGPQYIISRVFVADSAEVARSIFADLSVFDLPEADPGVRPFEHLGDQPMPGLGDESHALGACFKCDDDNPLRHYRLVIRSGNTVLLLYTWGRDAGGIFNGKLVSKL